MLAAEVDRLEVLQRVSALIDRAETADRIIPDETGYFAIDSDLVREINALLDASIDLLGEVVVLYETDLDGADPGAPESAEEEVLVDIGAQISSELAAQEVSGLALITSRQLQDLHTGLNQAIASNELWAVASQADTGLRRLGKALIAVESAIREYEDLEPLSRRWVDVDDSIEIRRLYGQFRRAILRDGEPADEELPQWLRRAGTRIAILRHRSIYPFLRIDDRVPIRQLQKRIAAWLVDGAQRDARVGRQLWEDLIAFARLLGQVNHREELMAHDRRLIDGLLQALVELGASAEIAEELRERLEQLSGSDDDLDLLVSRPDVTASDLLPVLERRREELARSAQKELSLPRDGAEGPSFAD